MNEKKSGINIGNVGGSLNINAGGDIVGGDKKVGDTNITIGFKKEEDKSEFLGKINELKSYIREINNETKNINTIDDDKKDDLIISLTQQLKNMKDVEGKVKSVSTETKPSKDIIELVKNNLDNFEDIIKEIKKENGEGGILNKILPIAEKALPILLSARHLFGLP